VNWVHHGIFNLQRINDIEVDAKQHNQRLAKASAFSQFISPSHLRLVTRAVFVSCSVQPESANTSLGCADEKWPCSNAPFVIEVILNRSKLSAHTKWSGRNKQNKKLLFRQTNHCLTILEKPGTMSRTSLKCKENDQRTCQATRSAVQKCEHQLSIMKPGFFKVFRDPF